MKKNILKYFALNIMTFLVSWTIVAQGENQANIGIDNECSGPNSLELSVRVNSSSNIFTAVPFNGWGAVSAAIRYSAINGGCPISFSNFNNSGDWDFSVAGGGTVLSGGNCYTLISSTADVEQSFSSGSRRNLVCFEATGGQGVVQFDLVTNQEFNGVSFNAVVLNDILDNIFDNFSPSSTTINFSALPVELSEFDVKKTEDNHSLVYWQTQSEINNDYFSVERSEDGSNFEEIGRVKGVGTTTEVQNYQFLDKEPFVGNNYYRLKQVDFDGAFEYSEIKVVFFNEAPQPFGISIFPNPATNLINVRIGGNIEESSVRVEIYNKLGQLMGTRQLGTESGGAIIQTNLFPAGAYTIVAKAGDTVTRENIVIVKE